MSRDLIRARFIEAADVERRMPKVSGPRAGSCWPAYGFSDEERKGWLDEDIAEENARNASRRPITAAELSRYSEVIDWSLNMIPSVDMRRLVWTWAFCQVIPGRSFATACNRKGWKRSTAYARLERLWDRLDISFCNARCSLREPRGYAAGQHETVGAPSDYTLPDYVSAAVPNEAFRTEPSRDLIRSEEDADAFAAWLEKRNANLAKRRRKLGLDA